MAEPICPKCKADLKYIQGGISKNTGKPYSPFWSCSRRCGYTQKTPPNAQNSPFQLRLADKEGIILDEIMALRKEFNDRMDSLAQYLVKKLDK